VLAGLGLLLLQAVFGSLLSTCHKLRLVEFAPDVNS